MCAKYRDDLVGARLSHYRVCSPLGTGGMGAVYRARDERLERDVALKVLAESLPDAAARRSLVSEARILSRLNHPNVAAVYDFDRALDRDFLVLEFVPGLTLDELVADGPLQAAEVVRLGIQVARGLAAAHAAGVIHRDIKPANIKMTPSGELKLLDFGIATLLSDTRTPVPATTGRASGPLGTVPFMSPEQLRGEPIDERSDIFSAGAVLYHMATGRPPFPQRQLACLVDAVLNLEPTAPCELNAGLTRALEAVVLKALRKKPSDRYQNAGGLAVALDASMRENDGTMWRLGASASRWWSALVAGRRRMTEIL